MVKPNVCIGQAFIFIQIGGIFTLLHDVQVDTLQSAIEYIKALEHLVTQKRSTKKESEKENTTPVDVYAALVTDLPQQNSYVDDDEPVRFPLDYQDQSACTATQESSQGCTFPGTSHGSSFEAGEICSRNL